MSKLIKATAQTAGWEEIEQLFKREILDKTDFKNVNKKLSPDDFKAEAMARVEASKIVDKVLKKINKIKNDEEAVKKVVYR